MYFIFIYKVASDNPADEIRKAEQIVRRLEQRYGRVDAYIYLFFNFI